MSFFFFSLCIVCLQMLPRIKQQLAQLRRDRDALVTGKFFPSFLQPAFVPYTHTHTHARFEEVLRLRQGHQEISGALQHVVEQLNDQKRSLLPFLLLLSV